MQRIFHPNRNVTTTDEGLQTQTYSQHSWPVSSTGSLTCHTYSDIGHPFIWSSPCWNSDNPGVLQGSCHYLCNGIYLSRPGIEPQSSACRSNALPTELQRRSGFLVNENTENSAYLTKSFEIETAPTNKKKQKQNKFKNKNLG